MESRPTAWRGVRWRGGGIQQKRKTEKDFMDMENSVVIAGLGMGMGRGERKYRGINGNVKNTI